MPDKPLYWVGSVLSDLREFPEAARRIAGHELHQVQLGLEPSDWKPMSSIGAGVREIRIHTGVEHRIFYVAKFADGAVYVLHAFQKKAQRTRHADIEIGQQRLRDVLDARRVAAVKLKRQR